MRVTWSDDGAAAYLIDEGGRIVGRWFRDRPEMSTFDPATYEYGQGYGYQAPGQQQSYMYDAWQGGGQGDAGGNYQDPDRMAWDEFVRQFNLTHEETVALREQYQSQHDDLMASEEKRLAQELQLAREQMAHETGLARLQSELRIKELEVAHKYAIEYLNLDWAERHKQLDKELGMRLREIQGQERMAAAQTWWRPMDYGAYAKWMAGEQAMTTESGLPVGAPGWQTGEPEPATVGTGAVGTGSADPYGVKLAGGGRIQEFGAWGGPTGPVMGTPWVAPHQANLTQFANTPRDQQEMAYGRWRSRGISPESAAQAMYASAPTGTAGQRVPGYG